MIHRTEGASPKGAETPDFRLTDTQDSIERKIDVVAGFKFLKANGDHRSSCRWIVRLNEMTIGEIVRINLYCSGQIAWRAIGRLGVTVGYGRTRTDAAFNLLCNLDQVKDALSFDALYGVPEYSLKNQQDGVQADCELLANSPSKTAEVLESLPKSVAEGLDTVFDGEWPGGASC